MSVSSYLSKCFYYYICVLILLIYVSGATNVGVPILLGRSGTAAGGVSRSGGGGEEEVWSAVGDALKELSVPALSTQAC
jgi:hypothetical protein